jgi:hypothetical protein
MSTPLREAALAAIAARLTSQLSGVAVERSRRAPVDVDKEHLPRVVLTATDWTADETAEPLATHYTLGFTVSGYVTNHADLAVELAMSALHARVVAALAGWTPDTAGVGEVSEEGAEFRLYDADESARPTGEFAARFSILCIGGLGNPYAA